MRIASLALFAALCAGSISLAQASAPAARYQEAIEHYKSADYRSAIQVFQELVDEGYVSYDLYYNLGNAAYKNGDLGTSVLSYERALTVKPGSEEVKHNLNVVRARLRDRVESIPLLFFVRWWNNLKNDHQPTIFFIWSLGFFFLLAAAVFVFFGYRHVLLRRFALAAGIVFFSGFAAALALSLQRTEELNAHRSAIVMLPEVSVRSTPDDTGVESFIIHEGLKVDILGSKNTRYRIRLEDGKNGWVEKSVLTRI
ncbi:MAG: tetratricopeptide repeat protein [Bacteroidota bacterium]